MSLQVEILKANSRYNVERVSSMVLENPELFSELVSLTLQGVDKVALRASWILTCCTDQDPDLLNPYFGALVEGLPGFRHSGIRRNVLRAMISVRIPELYQGVLFEWCEQWLVSKKEPIAVRVFAMELLYQIASLQPDMKNEVALLIMDIIPGGSQGIISRGKKILCKLGVDSVNLEI